MLERDLLVFDFLEYVGHKGMYGLLVLWKGQSRGRGALRDLWSRRQADGGLAIEFDRLDVFLDMGTLEKGDRGLFGLMSWKVRIYDISATDRIYLSYLGGVNNGNHVVMSILLYRRLCDVGLLCYTGDRFTLTGVCSVHRVEMWGRVSRKYGCLATCHYDGAFDVLTLDDIRTFGGSERARYLQRIQLYCANFMCEVVMSGLYLAVFGDISY